MAVKRLIDANIILRYLLNDVPTQYTEAARLLEKAPKGSLIISAVIVAEVTYIMRAGGYDRSQIVTAIGFVLALESAAPAGNVLHETLRIYESEPALDFADSYLIAKAVADKVGLESFDKKLVKIFARIS